MHILLTILDEADKLLESQFDNKLYLILPHLQKERRTGLFSATMSSELEGLLKVGLKDPIHIQIELQTKTRNHTSCIFATLDSTSQFDPFSQNAHKHLQTKFCSQSTNMISEIPSTLENYYFTVNSCREKLPFLISFAENHNDCKILVFLPTCASVEFFYNLLIFYLKNHSSLTAITEKSNLNTQKSSRIMEVLKMHGKLTQKKRNKIYNQFLTLQSGLLLTTDLLARGIDIQGVHWIFQFDPPQYSQSFLHRIGRTARAGNCGNVNFSFLVVFLWVFF
jgi:ATP-dependent RNA helicase DDX55/SPB4